MSLAALPSKLGQVSFNRDVRPILVKNCFSCHGMDERTRKADLRLDDPHVATAKLPSGETAIVPGDPAHGALMARIYATDESEIMPPPETRRQLSRSEKELLKTWIASGAKYERPWSLVKPARHEPPAVRDAAWPRNDIDRFVLHSLEEKGLSPPGSGSADAHSPVVLRSHRSAAVAGGGQGVCGE